MPPEHGTRAGYRAGCRCLVCKAANATYQRLRYRLRQMGRLTAGCRVEARTTWEQVRWLLREGYRKAQLARLLGRATREFNLGRHVVSATTAARIAALYRHHVAMESNIGSADVGMGQKK